MNAQPFEHCYNTLSNTIPLRLKQHEAQLPITNGIERLKGDIALLWVISIAMKTDAEFLTVDVGHTNLVASIDRYKLNDWVVEFSLVNN